MGRKKLLSPYEKEYVLKVLQEHGMRSVLAAEQLGVCDKTLRTYLKKVGIPLKVGRPLGARSVNTHYSCFANWLREHKGTVLPKSVMGIVRLTGCTEKAVRSYLDRRRKKLETKLNEQIGDLRQHLLFLEDTRRWRIPTKAFKTYRMTLDVPMETVKITATLRTGQEADFIIPLRDLLAKYKKVLSSESAMPGSTPKTSPSSGSTDSTKGSGSSASSPQPD